MKEDIISSKGWDKVAYAYQKRYMIQVSSIVYSPFGPTETELNLLGKKKNKKIIDIGAGGCQKAIYLAKHGAKVTAFDISKKQLDYGRKLAVKNNASIKFIRGDFQFLGDYLPKNYFDIAYSIFALQYCRNVKILNKTFSQVQKVLKKNGIFVFSLDHPIRSLGVWDIKLNKFAIDNYFYSKEHKYEYIFPEANISGNFKGAFWTLSEILNGVIKAGFKIQKVLEPTPIKRKKYFDRFGIVSRYGTNNKQDPFHYNNLKRIPGAIIIKAIKE